MEPIVTHKKKANKGKNATAQPPSPAIRAEKEAVDVNNNADGSISGDIKLVSGSIIDDAATDEQGVAMPIVPTGKKAKKAAKKAAARAKEAAETSVQPAQPPSLTEEEVLDVSTDADGYSSDDNNMSIVSNSVIADSTTEETRMAMSVVAQQEKPSKGVLKKAAARAKKHAARVVDTDFNTAIVTAAITKIVFASTLFGSGASHIIPKAASFIFVKEHILAGPALLAALFLVLDVSFADIVTNCRIWVITLSRFVDARDREELHKLVACFKMLCRRCGKALLEAVVDVVDDLPGNIGVKWVKGEKGQEDENEGYEAEDEQTEL